MEIKVTVQKFNELDKGCSIGSLTRNKAIAIIQVGTKSYISHSAMAKPGRKHNWSVIWANECVHISRHNEECYTHDERTALILEGREDLRGYVNQIAIYNGETYVMIGEKIEFVPMDEQEIQTSLF